MGIFIAQFRMRLLHNSLPIAKRKVEDIQNSQHEEKQEYSYPLPPLKTLERSTHLIPLTKIQSAPPSYKITTLLYPTLAQR